MKTLPHEFLYLSLVMRSAFRASDDDLTVHASQRCGGGWGRVGVGGMWEASGLPDLQHLDSVILLPNFYPCLN